MARLMLSAGMFSALAAAMAVRSRGLESASPPPFFAAMLISLMSRVKIFPRLASAAPFLCLIVCHLEWPDMGETPENAKKNGRGILADHQALRPVLDAASCREIRAFERAPSRRRLG